ncbi:hypothetical protein [Micrococcus luteus]|uniref:hypothetical protein n=1 Tax=Micrococcus luteus TaxID=1270 RepID=UPI00097EF981|nr:hypothetical protein [Micrococcus luteus]SJN30856.1 hypothetical protein FM117_06825 [Micrococcus luteus Mu201]
MTGTNGMRRADRQASGIPASGIPARGRRAPLAPGHTYSLRSGARSPRVYGELAEELTAGMLEKRPDLAAYPEALGAWATAEAQAVLMRRELDENGMLDPETGRPRDTSLRWHSAFEKRATKAREALGLDPRSEAALARERAAASALAVDLESLAEAGRQSLAQRAEAGVLEEDQAGRVLAATIESGRQAQKKAAAEFYASGAHLRPHGQDETEEER